MRRVASRFSLFSAPKIKVVSGLRPGRKGGRKEKERAHGRRGVEGQRGEKGKMEKRERERGKMRKKKMIRNTGKFTRRQHRSVQRAVGLVKSL